MIYKEEKRDLFSVPDDYYLAHCISADFGMGKGIVVEFNKRFNMKNTLMQKYPDYMNKWNPALKGDAYIGDCIVEGRVMNLITKYRYWNKPTYDSLTTALTAMAIECQNRSVKKLAMPLIGCGLDRLEWNQVSEIIKDVFKNIDIEILVCIR